MVHAVCCEELVVQTPTSLHLNATCCYKFQRPMKQTRVAAVKHMPARCPHSCRAAITPTATWSLPIYKQYYHLTTDVAAAAYKKTRSNEPSGYVSHQNKSSRDRVRTYDLSLRKRPLYPLSYTGRIIIGCERCQTLQLDHPIAAFVYATNVQCNAM